MRRQRRRGQSDYQQHRDQPGDEVRQQGVDRRRRHGRGQHLADQPHRQDRHQYQPDAVDRGGQRAVALPARHVAAAVAAAQPSGRPTTARRSATAQKASGVRSWSPELRPCSPRAPRRRTPPSACARRRRFGPSFRHTVTRDRRIVPLQQRAAARLAAQLGHALEQLVGAGDDHLALLDAAFADRRLLGQPFTLGLDRLGLGRLVGAGLDLSGASRRLVSARSLRASCAAARAAARTSAGLLAQRIDLALMMPADRSEP